MPRLRTMLAAALLLAASSCLEIDAQDVYVHFDAEQDRIDLMLVHRGVFAEAANDDTEKALRVSIDDLDEARQTGEIIFWNNWPLRVNPIADGTPATTALFGHLDVENGELFTDPKGTLCAYQFVRINRAKVFFQKINTLLELWMQNQEIRDHELDDDSRDLIRDFVRSREKLLVVGEGRFELRLPFSDRDNRWLKQELLREVFLDSAGAEVSRRDAVEARRKLGGSVTNTKDEDGELPDSSKALAEALTSTPALRFLWDNDVSILREQGLTTLRLGVLGGDSLHLHKAPGGLYHHELRDALRERGDRIEDGVPKQELERRFEAFRGREAKLPPELAAKRG